MTIKVNPFKHHLSRWPIVMPLYDGRQCPMCSAIVLGWKAQELHENEHNARAEWEDWAVETIYELCARAGVELKPRPDGQEFDGYVIGSGELPPETRGGED